MNKAQKKRLLNVAKALREDKDPERFQMYRFADCGTPCCALGHYAARKDLQRVFRLSRVKGNWLGLVGKREGIGIDAPEVHKHFGIDYEQADELFGCHGCGCAQTPIDAAEYIEQFVENHS